MGTQNMKALRSPTTRIEMGTTNSLNLLEISSRYSSVLRPKGHHCWHAMGARVKGSLVERHMAHKMHLMYDFYNASGDQSLPFVWPKPLVNSEVCTTKPFP